MLPQYFIEFLEKRIVQLHLEKRVDLYSLISKHRPDVYAKTQRKQKIPESIRWKVWRRDVFTCVYCLNHEGILTLDHIVPERLGGTYDPDNLVTACGKCNQRKGASSVENFIKRRWLKRKRQLNRKRISTTQATQARAHLQSILRHRYKTTGLRP